MSDRVRFAPSRSRHPCPRHAHNDHSSATSAESYKPSATVRVSGDVSSSTEPGRLLRIHRWPRSSTGGSWGCRPFGGSADRGAGVTLPGPSMVAPPTPPPRGAYGWATQRHQRTEAVYMASSHSHPGGSRDHGQEETGFPGPASPPPGRACRPWSSTVGPAPGASTACTCWPASSAPAARPPTGPGRHHRLLLRPTRTPRRGHDPGCPRRRGAAAPRRRVGRPGRRHPRPRPRVRRDRVRHARPPARGAAAGGPRRPARCAGHDRVEDLPALFPLPALPAQRGRPPARRRAGARPGARRRRVRPRRRRPRGGRAARGGEHLREAAGAHGRSTARGTLTDRHHPPHQFRRAVCRAKGCRTRM
jgi:hypothetical protein